MKQICLFIIILIFIGCKKDNEVKTYYVPQDIKNYAYFKTGTWWVYEEELTNKRDCVLIVSNNGGYDEFDGKSGPPKGIFEYFNCTAHSYLNGYDYTDDCNPTWTKDGRSIVFRGKSKPGDYVGSTILLFNKFIIGSRMYPYTQTGEVTLTAGTDSLLLKGEYYHKVHIFNDSKNSTEEDSPTNFFVARNIGIIRKEIMLVNENWNLVSYHIVQ